MWLQVTARTADKRMRLQGMLLAHNHSPFLSCAQAALLLMASHIRLCTVQHATVEGRSFLLLMGSCIRTALLVLQCSKL